MRCKDKTLLITGGTSPFGNAVLTRFMMNRQDSFDLVEYAFNKGVSGDILMKQSPAASVQTLVDALKKIFDSNNEIQYIGSKRCKKLYETLLNKM